MSVVVNNTFRPDSPQYYLTSGAGAKVGPVPWRARAGQVGTAQVFEHSQRTILTQPPTQAEALSRIDFNATLWPTSFYKDNVSTINQLQCSDNGFMSITFNKTHAVVRVHPIGMRLGCQLDGSIPYGSNNTQNPGWFPAYTIGPDGVVSFTSQNQPYKEFVVAASKYGKPTSVPLWQPTPGQACGGMNCGAWNASAAE